jgi:16S rRNA (guanine527-N7)-methyltransferase
VTLPGVDPLVPPPPGLAQVLFGARLPLAVRYAWWLAGAGVERGLIGPREAARLWPRHLLNCVAVAALIRRDTHVVDLGSGAGLPGIVLAIARPDLRITLVEPMQRRIAFLDEVAGDLSLPGVQTRRASAEELATAKLNADFVIARAVAPVDRLAAMAGPLLRTGGQLLAIKGSTVVAEVSAGWNAMQRAGMTLDAAVLAIVAADGERPSASGAGDEELLPGVQIAELSAWQSDGLLCEGEAAEVPASTDPLALVLRLGRSGHGSPRHR